MSRLDRVNISIRESVREKAKVIMEARGIPTFSGLVVTLIIEEFQRHFPAGKKSRK